MDYSDLIPMVAIIFIFGAPIAAFIVSRVLAHQERMEMLRRGIVPPPNPREMRRAMKYGWTPNATQSGTPNEYGYYPSHDVYAQQQLRKGMQLAFVGLALLIGLGFIGYHGNGVFFPGPWLLGGLIPLFVGVAQIIGGVLGGASFGAPTARQRGGPPPGAGTTSSAGGESGGVTPPTYGGWRPGPIPEIEKPASPPDYRS
jgi:hypothetical protein